MIWAANINHYPFSGLRGWDLGARRRSVKYLGLCPVRVESTTASGWLHDVGDRTSPRGRRVRLPDTANASPSPCEPRATSDLRPIAMPDAFLVGRALAGDAFATDEGGLGSKAVILECTSGYRLNIDQERSAGQAKQMRLAHSI
jgi:hypothetical protein